METLRINFGVTENRTPLPDTFWSITSHPLNIIGRAIGRWKALNRAHLARQISLFSAFSFGRYERPGVPRMAGGATKWELDHDPRARWQGGGTIYYHIIERQSLPQRATCATAMLVH